MIRLLWTASTNIRYAMRRYLPSNVLLDAIRSRRGLKWGVPAMLLAIPYLLLANLCVHLIADGGPGWLHLIVLLCIINAFKFLINGPITAARLISVRRRERKHDHPRRQVPSAPVGHEALPDDEHGAAYLSRTSGALHT